MVRYAMAPSIPAKPVRWTIPRRPLGAHMSIAGGLDRAIERGAAIGCTAIQIFNKSSNQWAARALGDAEVERFRAARARARIDPVVAHDSYLINLCSPDDALYARSIGAVVEELERCRRLGVDSLVVHPGGHMGQGDDFGVRRMAGAIDDTCLSNEYKPTLTRVGKVSVLASRCDEVLKWAFPVGNPVAGIMTRGEPYWRGALGRNGPNPPDQPPSLCKDPPLPDSWGFGHASYINATGPIVGPPSESGFFPLPLVIPLSGTQAPPSAANWQQAWAAGFVSTRFS